MLSVGEHRSYCAWMHDLDQAAFWHVISSVMLQGTLTQIGFASIPWRVTCCRCFMWYVQKVMQFINRNAYIVVAVKGTGYCTSAGRAIKLIVNNALRLVAVNIMVDVVVW